MKWSVLLLLNAPRDTATGIEPIILYGCMVPQTKPSDNTATVWTSLPADFGYIVQEWRFEINASIASIVQSGLLAGQLKLAMFGVASLPALSAKAAEPAKTLQPAENIAREQRMPGSSWGVPPGFIGYPTLVSSFPLSPGLVPSTHSPRELVSTTTTELPLQNGRATLKAMQDLSGLPFNSSYAERLNRFEVMERPADQSRLSVKCRLLSRTCGPKRDAFEILLETLIPVDVQVVAKASGEVIFQSLYKNQITGFSVPLTHAPTTVEIRTFNPKTGDLILHKLVRGIASVQVVASVAGSSGKIDDELSRRAPGSRQDHIATARRFHNEIWNIGQSETASSNPTNYMRTLVDIREAKPALAEWFPVGINGELDVIARLAAWAEEPRVKELVIVDPFLSPQTFARLVRRIGRENLVVTAIASLVDEDPDQFGKKANPVALLQAALSQYATQFVCQLRVLNVVEGREIDDGKQKPVGQAFHDRYVILRFQDGRHRVFILTNSLNKAAGNWAFALSELSTTVADQVEAYVGGLLEIKDLAGGLKLISTLDWTNSNSAQPARANRPDFGPKLSRELLQTLSWLLGAPHWSGGPGLSRSSVQQVLREAKLKRLLKDRSPRLAFGIQAITTALRREARRSPPRTYKELATLLLGLGAICAWSHLSKEEIGKAFSPYSMRRLLPLALKRSFDVVPLAIGGSSDFDAGSLWHLKEGRELAWSVSAAIGTPRLVPSPDHRISGAFNIALAMDPTQTIRFVEGTPSRSTKEFGLHYILLALSEYSDFPNLPSPTYAKSLVLRTAAVLAMNKPRRDDRNLFSVGDLTFATRNWDKRNQSWGLMVSFDCATLALRVARQRGDLKALQEAETRADALASAVATRWPDVPADETVDWICNLLDWHGEDIVRVASAIEHSGRTVDVLWRKLIRRIDETLCVGKSTPLGSAFDLIIDRNSSDNAPLSEKLMAAVAYVVNTRSARLTRDAGKFNPVIVHCWQQAQDPLFFAFRPTHWRRRVRILIGIYTLLYRILDEAVRRGVTSGTGYFAVHLGGLVDQLLTLIEHYPGELDPGSDAECVLLARDRCRYDLSGLAPHGTPRPKLTNEYLQAIAAASASPPVFANLEVLLERARNGMQQGTPVIAALVSDVAEAHFKSSSPTVDLDIWWRGLVAVPFNGLVFPEDLVSNYALHRSDAASPVLKAYERDFGLRLGP